MAVSATRRSLGLQSGPSRPEEDGIPRETGAGPGTFAAAIARHAGPDGIIDEDFPADGDEGRHGPFHGIAPYERWRASNLRFRNHVAESIAEADRVLKDAGVDPRQASPPPPDYEDILLGVRGYLVGAGAMAIDARGRTRKRLTELVSGDVGDLRKGEGNTRG